MRASGGDAREGARRRGRRLARALLGLAASLLLPAAGAAAPFGRITVPREGARLAPGSFVDVAWTPLPAGVEEFELLLYLGDGATSVRLTEQLDPAVRRFRWDVPNLPSASARLAIRFNRGRGEEPGPESAPFEIVPVRARQPQPVAWRDGELWLAAPFTPAWRHLPADGSCAGVPVDRTWSAAQTAALRSWHDAAGELLTPGRSAATRAAATAPPLRLPLSRRPLAVPLRD